MSSPGLKGALEGDISSKIFKADDYSYILRKHIECYVNKNFYRDCEKIFDILRAEAMSGESLTLDFTITVPRDLSIDVAQEKLTLFFKHQGYGVIMEPKKDSRALTLSLRL